MNKEKIKVLQVLGGLGIGGMENLIMTYYREIYKEIEFDFLLLSEELAYDQEAERLGSRIYRVVAPKNYNWVKRRIFYRNQIKRFFFEKQKDYKIVHIHQGVTFFTPLRMAYKYKIPNRIIHSHGVDLHHRMILKPIYKWIQKYICSMANYYIACSENAARELFTKKIIKNQSYLLLNNAVDFNKYGYEGEKRKEVLNEIQIEDGVKIIGHVGRFSYQKNQQFLLEVLRKLLMIDKRWRLMLIGNGDEKIDLEIKSKELDVHENIIWIMGKSDVSKYYSVMDIFALPSLFEGLVISGIEAQVAGVPCVFSDQISENTVISEKAYLTKLDVDIWCNKITEIYNSGKKNKLLPIAQKFNIESQGDILKKTYYKML